jgi:predicted small lipoprotein YifL
VKRALTILLLTSLAGCHRKAPATPAPSSLSADTPAAEAIPPGQRYAESGGTLILPPPKPKVRPRPVDDEPSAPRPAPTPPVPPPSVEATPSDGAHLPLWKQRAKFY